MAASAALAHTLPLWTEASSCPNPERTLNSSSGKTQSQGPGKPQLLTLIWPLLSSPWTWWPLWTGRQESGFCSPPSSASRSSFSLSHLINGGKSWEDVTAYGGRRQGLCFRQASDCKGQADEGPGRRLGGEWGGSSEPHPMVLHAGLPPAMAGLLPLPFKSYTPLRVHPKYHSSRSPPDIPAFPDLPSSLNPMEDMLSWTEPWQIFLHQTSGLR